MTASLPLNGHTRPPIRIIGDWQPVTPEPVEEQRTPEPPAPVVESDAIAEAQAAAIRIAAEAEARAIEAKAAAEAEKQRLANERQRMQLEQKQADHDARIAEANRRRREAELAEAATVERAAADKAAEDQAAKEIEAADDKWRAYAIRFAIVCGIVSLPVQMSFFWNPKAPWMAAAPIMLEGAAWVVHRGARAAVASRRPVWHYRTIVWLLAFVAAGVNLYHGLHSFDPGTALATAFASIAGPGVWDLHEHGRIRKRDGALTRRERKAAERQAKAEARQRAVEEERKRAEKQAADEAAQEARRQLSEERQREFPEVWAEAVKIGAALGKAPDDPAVWPRAYRNIEGTEPGESIESITARRTAEKRVEAALTGTPVNTLSKTTTAQRANQMPRTQRGPARKPPKRQAGDTQQYVAAARRQASIAAKNAAQKDPS